MLYTHLLGVTGEAHVVTTDLWRLCVSAYWAAEGRGGGGEGGEGEAREGIELSQCVLGPAFSSVR